MYYKLLITLVSFFFVSIISTTSVFGTCNVYDFVEVSQINDISTNYTYSDSSFYVRGDTASYPVTLHFYFQNSELCGKNYTLRTLFNQIQQPFQKELKTINEVIYTKVTFNVNNLNIESYDIIQLLDSQGVNLRQLQLTKDEKSPTVSVTLKNSNGQRISNIVKPGMEVILDILVNDVFDGFGSDIYSIDVQGSLYYNGIDFNTNIENSIKPGNLKLNRSFYTDQTILVTTTDNLGFTSQDSILINVDNQKPLVSQFTDKGASLDGQIKTYSFSVAVDDVNFPQSNGHLNVWTNILTENVLGETMTFASSCVFIVNTRYICNFDSIPIVTSVTSDVSLEIFAEDLLGNVGSVLVSDVEIFIDSTPPEILNFYFENSFGGINIVSPSMNGSIMLYLEYFDETGLHTNLGTEKFFGDIQFPSGSEGTCGDSCLFWNFTTGGENSNFDSYIEQENGQSIFSILLRDTYGYTSRGNVTLLFDRYTPKILSSSYIEGDEDCYGSTNVRDSLIHTCEEFDIKVTVNELEEKFGEDLLILGNFTSISTKKSLVKPQCDIQKIENNLLEYSCVFENLRAVQGYTFDNYSIIVLDSAGNRAEERFEFEIFNTSNDGTDDLYNIEDLKVLAPLSRVLLDTENGIGEVTAWFEGEITENKDTNGFEIINYQLLNCEDFVIATDVFGEQLLRVVNENLYGNLGNQRVETIFTSNNGLDGVDRDFTMSFILDKFENPTLLNNAQTQCTMALLYRDDTTIYEPAQLINFSVEVDFYELPRGHLLMAYAEDLNSDLESIEKIEKTFGDAYDTYETLAEMCNTFTSISSTYSTVKQVLSITSNALKTNPYSYGTGKIIDEASSSPQGILSELGFGGDGIINQICGYVTCKNTLLPDVQEFLEELQFEMSFATCSVINDPSDLFGENN